MGFLKSEQMSYIAGTIVPLCYSKPHCSICHPLLIVITFQVPLYLCIIQKPTVQYVILCL